MIYNILPLAEGIQGIFVKNKRFNATLVSFHFYLPLNQEKIAADALLPYILTSCNEKFKSYSALNIELLRLYGAELSCSVSKSGDAMHIRMSMSVINDKFALDKESIIKKAATLLSSLVFKPSLENGVFTEEDLKREKRKTIERIEGEINDKRSFAKTRLLKEMFGEDPYGTFIYGTVEEVLKLDGNKLYSAWQRLLSNAYVRVSVVGNDLPDGIFEELGEEFSKYNRKSITDPEKTTPLKSVKEPREVIERYNVSQGKLTMGFSSEVYGQGKESFPLLLATDIFGGGPYSKLFSNVREKQSLCYYCSAAATRKKGFVVVSSGIDDKNAERVVEAVLKELECVQKGEFDDFTLNASKKAITDSLGSYYDNAAALDSWYSANVINGDILTPKSAIEEINKITKDQIVTAAQGLKLHTVYKLLSGEEK